MNILNVHKRLTRFEAMLARRSVSDLSLAGDARGLLAQLQGLMDAARRVERKAEDEGDHRTALAAIRELNRMVELHVKLAGDPEEKKRIDVGMQLDSETATRMAKTYLDRHCARSGGDGGRT